MKLEFDLYKKIFQKDVNNYILIDFEGKMKTKEQEIKIYYDKLSSVNIEYRDILTKQKIFPDEKITDIVGSTYTVKSKDISGYDLQKTDN